MFVRFKIPEIPDRLIYGLIDMREVCKTVTLHILNFGLQ